MKKAAAVFLILLLVCVTGFYFFSPSPAAVTKEAWMNADKNLIHRALTSQSLVQKWWPDSGRSVAPAAGGRLQISTEAALFTVVPAAFDLVQVDITKKATPIQSFITILPTQHDSTAISWKAELPERGVFGKFQNQLLARSLKRDMTTVLERLHRFLQNDKSIYGLTVKEEKVTDTLLVVTNGNFTTQALPMPAQLTSYKDALVVNANNDTLPDMLLAGNFYENNIQLGRYDADYGTILINGGSGKFTAQPLNGLVIKGQVRHIKSIRIGKRTAYIFARNNDSTIVAAFDKK